MRRKSIPKDPKRTKADHRPMLPEIRQQEDTLDAAVRRVRIHYDELNPYKSMKWR